MSCNNDTGSAQSVYSPILSPIEQDLYTQTSPIDLSGIDAIFLSDIPYDVYDLTKFDIWVPDANTATGVFIYIHGGGFKNGDKSDFYTRSKWDHPKEVRALLSEGIAVVTINYRLLKEEGETEGILKPLNDSRRALQYIKSNAEYFNIDINKVILSGNSAGAGTALWIATSDDKKDLNHTDVILHESTKVAGVALRETQASYDVKDKWVNTIFVDYGISWMDMIQMSETDMLRIYGISSLAEYADKGDYIASIDMLDLLTADDPEIWAANVLRKVEPPLEKNVIYHHAYHVKALKEKADAVGVPNVCYYGKPLLYADSSNENLVDFVIRKTR